VGAKFENSSSSLTEETGSTVTVGRAAEAFAKALRTSLKTETSDLSSEEMRRAEELLSLRYDKDEWNRKY
jgi:lipoate-protein ligase A